jgi:UDP-glucose 4-epimerase
MRFHGGEKMKIAVTGACGFIGSHVAEYLTDAGHKVLGLDNLSTGKRENLRKGIDFGKIDCADYYQLVGELKDFEPEAIIHLAAQSAISTSWENPLKDAYHNVIGTLSVIRACKEVDVRRIVFSSTSAVYDENLHCPLVEGMTEWPTTPYGISKLSAERYLQILAPVKSIILRFGNVYGPRQVPIGENQVIPLMIRHLEKKTPFSIHGDGMQKRDFIYVLDVAAAIRDILESTVSPNPGVYNIASGQSETINHVADLLSEIYGMADFAWQWDDQKDSRNIEMNVREAVSSFDWKPIIPLKAGLLHTVAWWKAQP